jgi:hypothetical protein
MLTYRPMFEYGCDNQERETKMNEITPRFLPLDFPRKERGLDATKFELVLNESNARGPDGQRQGPVSAQPQLFYADPNGPGGTGHGSGSSAGGTSGTGVAASGTKQVETKNHGDGTKTVKLKDFKPPGWEAAAGNPEACYKLACSGASQTAPAGQDVTGGGGIILYDDKTGLGSEIIKRPAQRIHTDKDASAVALEQIKRHIDDGRAVVAGVSEPASSEIVDGPKIVNGKEKPGTQPVTNHYVAVYGYETDAKGKITGLYAKDNAVPGAPDISFKVGADGSITKPEDPRAPSKYMKQEYQLSEVKFHEGFEYKGQLQPKNDDGNIMYWPHP